MTAKQIVLRDAMAQKVQIMPQANKRPSGLWLILNFGRFGEFTGDTEEDAWASAAASIDPRPGADAGCREALLWVLDELAARLKDLEAAAPCDGPAEKRALEGVEKAVGAKLEALCLDGER